MSRTIHNLNELIDHLHDQLAKEMRNNEYLAAAILDLRLANVRLDELVAELKKPVPKAAPAKKPATKPASKRPYTRRTPLKSVPKSGSAPQNPNTIHVNPTTRPVYDEEYIG